MKKYFLKLFLFILLVLSVTHFANADVSITENPSSSVVDDTSIKIEVTVQNTTGTVLGLKGQIGDKIDGVAPFFPISSKTTEEKKISGFSSVVTFSFSGLDKGHDYTIHIIDSTTNLPFAFSVNYKTTGVANTTSNIKVYVNGKITVGDTNANIKYTVITGGVSKNLSIMYSTTDTNLVVTTNGPINGVTVSGTDLAPGEADFDLTGLKPDTLYDFWVIDSDAIDDTGTPNVDERAVSIKNNFHTQPTGGTPFQVYAGLSGNCPEGEYCYLAPLGGNTSIKTDNASISDYLTYVFKFGIGLAGVLAVIMLIIAGIQYMGSDSFFSKEEAKGSITNALIGLLIALASYLILNTLNPDLVNLKLNIGKQEIAIEFEGDTDVGVGTFSPPQGIYCPKPGSPDPSQIPYIVNSMAGKVTYRYGGKGGPPLYNADTKMCDGVACKTFCPPNTTCLDCSGFVNIVLQCAGMNTYNGGTSTIFSGAPSVTSLTNTQVNGINLKLGDLLGWNGHVMIYVGGGTVFDSHGGSAGRKPGQAIGVWPVTKYIDKIKFYKTQ